MIYSDNELFLSVVAILIGFLIVPLLLDNDN